MLLAFARPRLPATAAGRSLLLLLLAMAVPASGQNILQRSSLTGNWGGARDELTAHGLDLQLVYTGDVFADVAGGVHRRAVYLDNVDLTLTCHLDDLTGVDAGSLFLYGLANHGEDPSHNTGDVQGLDNIAAPHEVKLYEAWWQKELFDHHLSALAGLYDLNSEFDVIDTAALFINSSFGISAAFGMSGVNGPSIFPDTAVGVRFKTIPFEHVAFQTAVLDGVAGDPRHPGETAIRINAGDGVLIASELQLIWPRFNEPEIKAMPLRRRRRRRVGRGWQPIPYSLKIALGTWFYTARMDTLDATDSNGRPVREQGHPGVYLLADAFVYQETPSSNQGLSLFARVGLADGDVQQIAAYTGGGAVYTGPFPGRPADQLGLGVTAAHNGQPFKRASKAAGNRPADGEVAVEATYRAELIPWLALQPDVQYIIHPGGLRVHGNALVIGLRTEVTF